MDLGFKHICKGIFGAAGLSMALMAPAKLEVPVRPIENKVVTNLPEEEQKNILVIDNFDTNVIDIDCDRVPDMSHGEVVSAIIENGLPNANIDKKNIKIGEADSSLYANWNTVLSEVKDSIKSGKKYDAINLSVALPAHIQTLANEIDIDLNNENLTDKISEVREYLANHRNENLYERTNYQLQIGGLLDIVDNLDTIGANGTKLYLATGNNGHKCFNMLSLSDNVINVGALNKHNDIAYYSAKNSDVDRYANGNVPIKRTKKGFGIGAKKTNLDKQNSSSIFKLCGSDLIGTSFAAPNALVEDLKEE